MKASYYCNNNINFMLEKLLLHKTYNKTRVTSKDQPVHPPSIARVLVHPSLDSPEAVEGTSISEYCSERAGCSVWSEPSLVAQVLL